MRSALVVALALVLAGCVTFPRFACMTTKSNRTGSLITVCAPIGDEDESAR